MEHPKRDALKWYLSSSVSFENMLLAHIRGIMNDMTFERKRQSIAQRVSEAESQQE